MQIIKLKPSTKNQVIKVAINTLKNADLIIFPTETCYGLGADATNQQAVNKLFKFKTRREGKYFSVAVADQAMAEDYVKLNETAKNLYQNFLPGPLTIVSKVRKRNLPISKQISSHSPLTKGRQEGGFLINTNKNSKLASPGKSLALGIGSEFNTLGIRIPDHLFVLELVKQFGRPITATSANASYQSPPYSVQQWQKQTPQKAQALIDLWIDAGKLPKRPPSTVIDTTVDELTILRQGSLKFDQIAQEHLTHSEIETHQLAKQTIINHKSEILNQGLVIGLQGQLGAGKTQFCKGIAQALGITQTIKSPTFTLVNEYPILTKSYQLIKAKSYFYHKDTCSKPFVTPGVTNKALPGFFYHIDIWRIEKLQELLNIGFENMLKPGNIIAIEWVEKVSDLVQKLVLKHKTKTIWIDIIVTDRNTRTWKIT